MSLDSIIYGAGSQIYDNAIRRIKLWDDFAYEQLKPLAQDPYVGSLMGTVPVLGDYMRAHEQADSFNNYLNAYDIEPKQVTYPVSTYGQQLPSVGGLAFSALGLWRRRRRIRNRKARKKAVIRRRYRYVRRY